MTDDLATYGLGALPDAPDERDFPVSALYAAEGRTASVAWQDRRDQERYFDFDEPAFFAAIGGTADGAWVRDAMERMRTAGNPIAGVGEPAHHRIAAYYAVPRDLVTVWQLVRPQTAVALYQSRTGKGRGVVRGRRPSGIANKPRFWRTALTRRGIPAAAPQAAPAGPFTRIGRGHRTGTKRSVLGGSSPLAPTRTTVLISNSTEQFKFGRGLPLPPHRV